MEIELNQDIVAEILDFLGDRVTLFSKDIRHNYFKKNGIWIHFIDVIQQFIKCIPKSFYQYSLNLDFAEMESMLEINQKYVVRLFNYLSVEDKSTEVSDYIFNNTVFIRNTPSNVMEYFPNIRRVEYVRATASEKIIDFLKKNKVIDCKLVRYNVEGQISADQKILDKIIECGIKNIYYDKIYPNLVELNFNCESIPTELNPANFPRLKIVTYYPINRLDDLYKIFPNVTTIKGYMYGISEKIYEKIINYGYHIKLYVSNGEMSEEILELGNRMRTGNITLIYPCGSTSDINNVAKLSKLFKLEICCDYVPSTVQILWKKLLECPTLCRDNIVYIPHSYCLSFNEYSKMRKIFGKKIFGSPDF